MSDSSAIVTIGTISSGEPAYLDRQMPPNWPIPSASNSLVGALVGAFSVSITPRRETVFLTRAHQRIMDRALRRSVRIIA